MAPLTIYQAKVSGISQMTDRAVDSIDEIIVHCSAYHSDWWEDQSAQDVISQIEKDQMKAIGVVGFAYHYFIFPDGETVIGRPLNKVGAHCKGRNARSIGICLHGGFGSNATDKFTDHFTPEQDKALRGLIDHCESMLERKLKISGHNEYSRKACPGFQVKDWLKNKTTKPRTTMAQSKTVKANSLNVAATAGAAGTVMSQLGSLPQPTQYALIVLFALSFLGAAWVFKERILHWRSGVR